MKKALLFVLTLGLTAGWSAARADDMKGMKMEKTAKSEKVVLTGTLVDLACYLDDNATGNDHMGMKACGTDCLKGGSPAALLVDKTVYILAFPAPAFAAYVGQKVEISGDLYGMTNLIPAKAFAVGKDEKKKPINLKGKSMM